MSINSFGNGRTPGLTGIVPNGNGAAPGITGPGLTNGSMHGLNGPAHVLFGGERATAPVRDMRDMADVQMDQIRDLLFGEFRKQFDARLAVIEARVDTIERRLDAALATGETERRATLDELSRGVAALGEHIRRIPRP
jgi:hypothetical protein